MSFLRYAKYCRSQAHNKRSDRRRRRRPDTESTEPDDQVASKDDAHAGISKQSPSHVADVKLSESSDAAPVQVFSLSLYGLQYCTLVQVNPLYARDVV